MQRQEQKPRIMVTYNFQKIFILFNYVIVKSTFLLYVQWPTMLPSLGVGRMGDHLLQPMYKCDKDLCSLYTLQQQQYLGLGSSKGG